MTDVLTPDQRKRCMSAIRGKDTKPEMIVRRMVHGMGYRYRLHYKGLPGRPDLVFPGRRKVIFVHGCFWHMHDCDYGRVRPGTNSEFWEKKRRGTENRDRNNGELLRQLGWDVLIVWECQTRKEKEALFKRLLVFLDKKQSCIAVSPLAG
uniref:Very short patch repair endonuclease n=1 Tax=Candidatus Kentrum sp. LPFa TaxID=2126335 RepID=A0A450XHN9_9GAMM|nr:MAG: T/G mismatch-specific endonuclease [Candidatus Kentron sp. LPFa]VFK28811.1 MAG: T/G mismatch-specific endonuclease [Candidatus Kentron sp. LPFa]